MGVSKDNMADISKKPAYTSPQTPQTPLPTFPISATTLIIFLPIYKFILQKNFISPDERYKTPLPTFPISATTLIIFLPIYKFILQKNFLSPEQHDERHKKLSLN